jgi:hypothetical protein
MSFIAPTKCNRLHATEAHREHCPSVEEAVEFAPGNAVASA